MYSLCIQCNSNITTTKQKAPYYKLTSSHTRWAVIIIGVKCTFIRKQTHQLKRAQKYKGAPSAAAAHCVKRDDEILNIWDYQQKVLNKHREARQSLSDTKRLRCHCFQRRSVKHAWKCGADLYCSGRSVWDSEWSAKKEGEEEEQGGRRGKGRG